MGTGETWTRNSVSVGDGLYKSTDGGSNWSGSFAASEGVNSVQVRQTDVAGNVGAASAAFSFTLDTTDPAAPGVALTSDTGTSNSDKITSDGSLTLSGVETGATVEYSTDGGTNWSGSFTAVEGMPFTSELGINDLLLNDTDIDGDGLVGFSDLLLVLSSWGDCA